MKVNIEIECTPLEARQFFGLPDVQPMQQAIMAEMEKNILKEAQRFTPDAILQNWPQAPAPVLLDDALDEESQPSGHAESVPPQELADADPVPFFAVDGVLALQDHARADVSGSDRTAECLLIRCAGFDQIFDRRLDPAEAGAGPAATNSCRITGLQAPATTPVFSMQTGTSRQPSSSWPSSTTTRSSSASSVLRCCSSVGRKHIKTL